MFRPIPLRGTWSREEQVVMDCIRATNMTDDQQKKAFNNYKYEYDQISQDFIITLCLLLKGDKSDNARVAIRLCNAHPMPWNDWDTQ